MIEIRVRTTGDPRVIRAGIYDLKRAAEDLRPAWPGVIARFQAQMSRRFETEGGSGPSGRWAPLEPRYARWKARHFPGTKILERTGATRRSLTSAGSGAVIEKRPLSLFLGSTVPWAPYHQPDPKRRMFIEPTDREAAEWVAEIHRYFVAVGTRAGFTGRLAGAFA